MRYYPQYDAQPNSGRPPNMFEAGTADARASSGTAFRKQTPHWKQYGRQLSGTDVEVVDENSEPAWAANELALYAEQDDVQGSGIFDPAGAHPNIHPDAGVFAARYSLPGYHAREIPFARNNEVRDLTTGRPIIPVPSGAVSLDSAAQIAFLEQSAYRQPQNVIDLNSASSMPFRSIANVVQNPQPIGALPPPPPPNPPPNIMKAVALTALVGITVGAVYAYTQRKKRRR